MDDKDVNLEKYGEFICSFDSWLSVEKQKEKAIKMAEMTKNKDSKYKQRRK